MQMAPDVFFDMMIEPHEHTGRNCEYKSCIDSAKMRVYQPTIALTLSTILDMAPLVIY